MIKWLLLITLLYALASSQTITSYYVLPVQTTQDVITTYSFLFYTDTDIASNARVAVTFPFEFSPNALTQATRVRYLTNGTTLQNATWSLNLYTFTIQVNQIAIGNITIVIDGILNPKDYTTSSFFSVQTLFKSVIVTSNTQLARVPFTPAPTATSGGTVNNYVNTYIQQGSSWTFNFTLAGNYSTNSSIRIIFPQDFYSNKIQCNVSGVVDPNMQTRVFPSQNVYDCMNLKQPLNGTLGIVLSGVVNPSYQMTASGFQVHILQPNNMIVSEIISSVSTVLIKVKPLNLTLTIPNKYRNNSATYIFQINPDTNLLAGDSMVFTLTGLWTLFTNMTNIISGVASDLARTPKWTAVVNTTTNITTLTLTNFSMIPKTTQFTFYLPLVTPITPNTYTLTVKSYRFNGGLAQTYSSSIVINQTTGYIRQMKLHPMQRAIKLPVGQTGPLEIVLFLQNNLPQTNVLTYGMIVMEITPNIPAPIVGLNGVPKCYFYMNIPASNCTFDSSDSTKTVVTIFTPANFNFQQSEVPLTITTEGYQQPINQGITIDTLVKRYFFKIQFYSHLRPPPIPQEVIFDEWIPDSIPISNVACTTMTLNAGQYDHLKCTFVTPNQILNSGGHIHLFRIEFASTWYAWNPAANGVTPNYPCLMYGVNVSADPYVKCDYITLMSGPYKSSQSATSYNYITFYGLSTIPGGSTITFEIPRIQRYWNGYDSSLKFSILEDTPGYNSPIVYIYTQTINLGTNNGNVGGYSGQSPSVTLTNGVINRVTSITLNGYSLGTSGISHFVFQVDQTAFPNIGRGNGIACGSHTCSKFDYPIQYFVLYPSSTLGSTATLTFPSISTPPYSGSFTFYTRTYVGSSTQKKGQFPITISPDTIVDCSYKFSPLQSVSTLYPNSDRFYKISWTTVNRVLSLSGNSYVEININNIFTLSSSYCQLTTTATAYDGRGIFCQLSAGGTVISLKNLNDLPAGSTFNLTVQMRSTSTTSTVSPTVNIKTYYGNGALVDQALNVQFVTYPLTNTNLTVFSSFVVPPYYTSVRAITAGYFGNLLVNFQPQDSGSVVNGSKIILTMATGFNPPGNVLNLPLSCLLNNVRSACTYTINPFVITITGTNSQFSTSNNIINITTLYQASNGIVFPSTPGRYLLQLEILNSSISQSLEKVQQYVDLLPGDVSYFNVSWAHRDINQYNIFTVQFQNGQTVIPSYNDATTAGRIYIGFPMSDSSSNAVFAANLGFSGIVEGTVLPCYFDSGTNFVTATATKSLTCKIRTSTITSLYYTWIEVINFAAIPAGAILRVIIGKILNPSLKQIDINFMLRIRTLTVSSNAESPLYQTTHNMFIDMLTASITNRNELNSSSIFFQGGSSVGQTSRYFNMIPYTANTFQKNDWFIVNMDPQFPLNGNIYNCLSPFYQYCIIYPTINWLAVKIGNGTLISLQPVISQLPISISRVDTTFTCYTFESGRWSETITYTVTAAARWLQIRGAVSGFSLSVLGSQNKINVAQKDVEVLVTFNVSHMVPVGGSIEIQFPSNASAVPAIKPHCRSAVTLGSALNGYKTGKPSVNVEGEIGCLVQNTYSWMITGFDVLPAGSQVKIYGHIDFPTVPLNSLGMGFICTYSNQDPNAFTTAKTIDYLTTSFPLPVQNLTWNVDTTMAMLKAQPLRINYVGDLKFLIKLALDFNPVSSNPGIMSINLWYTSITGAAGGFNGPTSNLVCTIFNPLTGYKYGCYLAYYATPGTYMGYQIKTYQTLPANTNYEVTLTTQKGSATEGINFPTVIGTYKVQIQVDYYSNSPYNRNQAYFIDVYGPNFNTLYFNSTVTIPGQNNFIIVILTPSQTINTNQQIVIQIPTKSLDGQNLFPIDLGMGYANYDSLVFDIFQSGITSMTCKVYTGQLTVATPVKVICSGFDTAITTANTLRFGFWVVNPASSVGMAIPVQVYAFDQPSQTKFIWSIVEAGIRILPITTTPINDIGNFQSSSAYRQVMSTTFSFTTRNTKAMVKSDWYILKFGFDLRNTAGANGSLSYNSDFAGTGDVIFLRNSQTILLRIGSTPLSILSPGVTTLNAKINSLFYNPSYQLNTLQSLILAYAIYNSADVCEKIIYSTIFPSLPPNQPSGPTFSMALLFGNRQMGQFDDYKFSFAMSSAAGNSASLVKLISIQFPPFSTYDFTIKGKQCHESSSSAIEISSCYIDPNSRVIWITPVVKASYTDNMNLIIQTAGLAIQNPVNNLTIDVNQFTIRYYTWPAGSSQPSTLIAGSDNWCFMKQDSTTIASNTISYNFNGSTYYSPHSYVSVPQEVIVNEWEPADYYISNASATKLAKTPFSFKLIAPTTFNGLSGNSYHTISLYYGTYYSNPTLNTNTDDLYQYVPTCELNGFRIHSCSISSDNITMYFQQSIANGQQITVRFSIVNPTDETDEGFTLTTLADGTIVLPIYIKPNGGSTYYLQQEPFHPFYRTLSVGAIYPSMGIQAASIAWGTQAQGQLNYLEFVIVLTRNDINGLVLEIPVISEDGTIIYNTPTLFGLPSGSKYPCSMGIYAPVFCYYVQGSSTNYGSPTRIYITNFDIPGNYSLSFRMLFTNPDNNEVFPKFTFKAFGGSFSAPSTMGDELKGMFTLVDPFKVYDKNTYLYPTGTTECRASKALWQTQTSYDCYIGDQSQPVNTYAILKWPLVDSIYGTIGDYSFSSGLHYDHFFVQENLNFYVYVVVKLTSAFVPSASSYYRFRYLRMKHHIVNSYKLYILAKDWTRVYTASVSNSWHLANRVNTFGTFTIETIDLQIRQCNAWSWHYFSVNTGTANTIALNGRQPSSMIVEITFVASTFTALHSSYTTCNIEAGVIGYDSLNPVRCFVDVSNSKILLYNVYGFTNNPLKIFYYAKMACSQTDFDVTVKLFANQDAYTDYTWPIFQAITNTNFNLNDMWYSVNSGNSVKSTAENSYSSMAPSCSFDSYITCTDVFQAATNVQTGYSQIISVTTSSIVVRVLLNNGNYDFGSQTFRLIFRFYTPRLTMGACSSVSAYSSYYTTNGWCQQGGCTKTCGSADRRFYAAFYLYREQTYQQQWPLWYSGQYYDITFNFAANSVGLDASNYANSVFVHATLVWENSRYYHNDEGKCGCCGYTCCHYSYCETCSGSNPCNNAYYNYQCCSDACSCRWMYDWNYVALINDNDAWSQTNNLIAQSVSAGLVSRQLHVETEFYFYLQNLKTGFTPTMTSRTAGSSAQLVVSFTGVRLQNPFSYITQSQSAAYIECLCVVSSSAITISADTTYTAANCTRYIIEGFPAFLTVRVQASTGQYLACYFPGFTTPFLTLDDIFYGSGDMQVNFYSDQMNHFKYNGLPEQFRSNYQTTGYRIRLSFQGSINSLSVDYNNTFWATNGAVNENKYFQMYLVSPYNLNSPILYYSSYSPHVQQSLCNSATYAICRAYNNFFSRRYFLVVQYSGSTYSMNITGNINFPQSAELSDSFYTTFIGWTHGGFGYYQHTWTNTLSTSNLSPAAPTNGYSTGIYSTNLQSTKSLMTVAVSLSGYTLYSSQRTQGPFLGSFISLALSGFSTVYGCGINVKNVPSPEWNNNAFYCIVQSNTQIKIYSNADWTFSDYMYITFYTDSVPSSSSYTFQLYDRYITSSAYGKAISVTGSFSRTVPNYYTIMQPTSVRWRRTTFKSIRTDAGPVKLTLNNNFQYVSTYSVANNAEDSSSDAILIYVPGSVLGNNNYYCQAREYPASQYSFYKEYVVNCAFYSANKIIIKSIPSHMLSPNYYYQFIVYKSAGSLSSLINIPSTNYIMQVQTINAYTSGVIQYYDWIPVYKYLNIYPIKLNSIHILTREAAAINSLYISFTIGVAMSSSNSFYLQFVFDSLDLNYFGISNGGNIPCYLNGFSTLTGRQNPPTCYGFADGLNNTSPLIIRLFKFSGFSANANFQIAFDNFNNPPLNTLTLTPINIRMNLVDRTNVKMYTSYFPNVYYSDSINVGVPSNIGGTIAMNDASRGASTYHQISLGWPYSSNSGDYSQKIVMKILGGITCCQSFTSLTLSDSQTGYTLLWANPGTNTSVYRTPTKSTIGTNWYISGVKNPNQVSYQTYIQLLQVTFIMYSSYKTSYITNLNQPSFASYSILSDFVVSSTPTITDSPANFNSHSYYPLTYEFSWNLASSSYTGRNISYIIMYFTSGVRYVDYAWIRYSVSPYFVNQNGNVKVGYDSGPGQWYVNITGVMDSTWSLTYLWYVRVRLYASGDNNQIYYTSNIYNYNGNLEFSSSSGNKYIYNDGWRQSTNYGNPAVWALGFQRYTKNYFQLSKNVIYAAASQTTNKLFFKFTAPYNMSQVESLSFISSPISYLASTTPNNGIYCIIQPTSLTLSSYGAGLYAPCSYSSGTYTVNIPTGGLTTVEYLLTIIDRQQLTSTFNMPTTPQRVEVSLIYNSMLNLQYGDAYNLDFAGQMTLYNVDHAHLMGGQYNMLGFTLTPAFDLPASSTSSPVTESVLSFEVESNYFDSCLNIASVFSTDGMPFYSGVYYSHYSSPASTNANTRILCGQNTQAQDWAPVKLTITDYGLLSSGTSYYFRFPLITLPSTGVNNVPLTYKMKLLQYSNGNAYPDIISQFRYENKVSAVNSYSVIDRWASLSLTNNAVQETLSVSFNYDPSYFDIYWTGYETIVKFDNDQIPALTSLATLPGLSNSGYSYQYYPNINLCSFIRSSDGSSYGFSLGTYPTSIEKKSFRLSFVYTFVGTTDMRRGYFDSGVTYSYNEISQATLWTTSTFTKGSNIVTSNSMDLYTVTWMASYLSFPEGSYMVLTFSTNLIIIDEYCNSYSGFIQGINANSNLVCKRYSTTQILLAGYATLSSSASLSISLYMQIADMTINNYTQSVNIVVYSSSGALIINANTASLTFGFVQVGSLQLGLSGTMVQPYSSGNSFPLYITFRLNLNTLVNGDYIQVDLGNWVLDAATSGTRIFKYKLSGNIYWVPSAATLVSGNIYNVPVYSNYSMTAGTQITLWIDTFAPTAYYGAKSNAINWNTFKIYAYKSSVLAEQSITRIWTEPFSHASFVATPALNYVGATALWEFSVTPNISASAGDTILMEFVTADGIQASLYSNNLGVSIPAGNSGKLDCNELYNTRIISSSTIQCRIYAGDNTQNPPIPTTIAIPITNSIASNTAINFNIIDIVNPSVANVPMSVVFKLATPCSSSDSNNLCAYYKSVTYFKFNSNPGVPGVVTQGSLTFNPSLVSATNTQHTASGPFTLNVNDFVRLKYYTQIPIPAVCAMASTNGVCYSYPITNSIVIKVNTSVPATYNLVLAGMTNPYQNFYGSNTFYTQIWRGGSIYSKFYTNYQATTITSDPTTGTPLTISFVPTLTPNYELKFNFNNIAKITLTKMLQNQYIKQIRINAPGEITIDQQYCNATMQTFTGEAIPYPYRFVCQYMGSNYVTLNMQSDFPAWTSGFTQRSIYLYLRYTIHNSQTVTSNNWNAYAYTDPSSTSNNYAVSYAVGNFPIVEYQLPFLHVINFPTESFSQRTCTIGQQCMIYGILYPTTPSSSIAITSMTFLLPKEFNYSSAQTFDNCFIQSKTTAFSSFSCPLARNNSQITIGFTPSGYNQLYNLFSLDHSVSSMLFTAPNYPGNHYQMQVNLWSGASSDNLVESQYINITTVYGYYLSVPLINFVIPRDASQYGLFDLTFTTGSADILPSYINSATYTTTSAIEISFANTFDAALGTGLPAGSEIACLPITGLTFNIMSKLTCRIYPSVSTITYPTIIITGYDRIYASTLVRIQIANLKTLAVGVTDFCTLGVSYTYYNQGGVKGYIYQPVSFVVDPTTAPATPKTITYTISEVNSNYVGELSNYAIAGSIATGFSPITTTDYFVVQFPPYIFEGRFNLNLQALCSLAASNACRVFGLAGQIYIQPATTVSTASFSFTIQKLLNAAYELQYIVQNITLFTVVGNKVNALGYATFTKFTQASLNASAIITSIDSIYGGDSGINYYFSFQLNSYLPENGKISIFLPSIFISLFTVNSNCYLRADSQLLVGPQAYCQIINTYQLVIVPNGVLLSSSQAYYVTVTNITNPNMDLSSYKFKLETYYSSNVYSPSIISRDYFSCPTFSLITVKNCQLQISASIYNQNLPSQYQINLICPATIKQSSELKLYLSWNPSPTSLTCSSDSNNLYSTQCNILTEYSQTTKLTYLSIYLRSIQAQKLVSITATVTNGIQGTYFVNSTINFNNFVYLQATSNSYYVTGSTSSSTTTLSVRSTNYPLNRYYTSIYTFALTNPKVIVSTLQIDIPSIITQGKGGVNCGYLSWNAQDSYFNLMLQDGTKPLICNMTGQKLIITGLSSILGNLSSTGFLYLTVNGLINPATSISQSNFTFTFINTTSSIYTAVGIYNFSLSYSISNAPINLQISSIALSDSRFFVNSVHTFTITSVQNANITIVNSSNMGIIIRFPAEYSDIWQQIATPSVLNLTINGVIYAATNITLRSQYLFARFALNTFTWQVVFTNMTVSFSFKNPNKSIDCTASPVYVVSFFDFQANSIFAETLSNNQICPTLRSRLFAINVTGNTKISAGSSTTFIVSIEKPAYYLAITPFCSSSAISFLPSVIIFRSFSSTQLNFTISAAVGLSGNFNVTFSKAEGGQNFYNDIQFTTLNIYIPTQAYKITIVPFSSKSTGYPIAATIWLEVPSPTDFALTFTTSCNNNFTFSPTARILIPAQATMISLYVTYTGKTVPAACQLNFSISSLANNNFVLATPIVYLSGKTSIDKSSNTRPLILELTTSPQNSTSVGAIIVSNSSDSSSSAKYQAANAPTLYLLNVSSTGANSATFIATTSTNGTIYYAILASGTPVSTISQLQIYYQNLSSAIAYGKANSSLNTSGVNTISNFVVKALSTQTTYIIAAYLNSTVGVSSLVFKNFTTTQSSNGASITLGMSSRINITQLLSALSNVWRIRLSRIGVLTSEDKLLALENSFNKTVMNNRTYIYEIAVAPDTSDDSVSPISLLKAFTQSSTQQETLHSFIPQYLSTYTSSTREILAAKPRVRSNATVASNSHDTVVISVFLWEDAYVYGVILRNPTNRTLSSQIINGLDANNKQVDKQHYSASMTNSQGVATLNFTLLKDNSTYTVFITAESVLPFKPRLSFNDTEVLSVSTYTRVNINLMKNSEAAVSVIMQEDPELAEEVRKHMNKIKAAEEVIGTNKHERRRNRK